MINNGNLIGKVNTPTTESASGVWGLRSNYNAVLSSSWPQIVVALFKSSATGISSLTAPSGISQGDLLVFAANSFGTVLPSGFTSLAVAGRGLLGYKLANGTESGTSIVAANIVNCVMLVYNVFGASITAPDAFSTGFSDADVPAQTILSRKEKRLAIGVCGHNVGASNPPNFTVEPPFANKYTSPVNSGYGSYVMLGASQYNVLPQLTIDSPDRGAANFIISGSLKIG